MPLDLICDVFKPVAERVISRSESLIGLEKQSPTLGLEGWLRIEAVRALGNLVSQIHNKGPGKPPNKTPDLELKEGDSTMFIELKGADNLNLKYLQGGVRDHSAFPGFRDCIFLGDGISKSQVNKLSTGDVRLEDSREFRAGEKMWIIGLLTPIEPPKSLLEAS